MAPAGTSAARDACAAPAREPCEVAPFSVTRRTSSDIDEQAAGLRDWNQVYEQMSPGRFVGGLHEMCFAGIQLFHESTSQAVHEAGAPWTGSRAIGVPVRMDGVGRFRGEPVAADALVTLGAGDELDFYTPRGFEIFGLVVDQQALEAHARQVEHRDLDATVAVKGVLQPGAERVSELRRLLSSAMHSLDVNPVALQHRQTQRVLAQSMLGAVVTVVAGDDAAPRCPAACAGRGGVVDTAKAFMRSRIAEPITVADLCRELGVSRRTLQYCFQEVLGINPVAFLRAMRLNGVRRDLKAARPADTVQDVAARWGFWHLGHFVTDYKRMFGELPSETLRGTHRAGSGARH